MLLIYSIHLVIIFVEQSKSPDFWTVAILELCQFVYEYKKEKKIDSRSMSTITGYHLLWKMQHEYKKRPKISIILKLHSTKYLKTKPKYTSQANLVYSKPEYFFIA